MHLLQLILIFILFNTQNLTAGGIDSVQVARLYNSSWKLVAQKKPSGAFKRFKKVTAVPEQRITIYKDEFHLSVKNGPYQICTYRLRNGNEFWLDGAKDNQLIYRVIEIQNEKLVMDILVRDKDKYRRTSRNTYAREKK
ncbi:MAG: hypothetical protein RL007_1860 [Bacteroidota bacterium]|jgi:hypothetical protein